MFWKSFQKKIILERQESIEKWKEGGYFRNKGQLGGGGGMGKRVPSSQWFCKMVADRRSMKGEKQGKR